MILSMKYGECEIKTFIKTGISICEYYRTYPVRVLTTHAISPLGFYLVILIPYRAVPHCCSHESHSDFRGLGL